MNVGRALGTAGTLATIFFALPAYAQFSAGAYGANIAILLSPLYPTPLSNVHLSLEETGVDLSGSSITWSAGGKVVAQGTGRDSVDLKAGALGSELSVEADVTTQDGTRYSAKAIIAPTQLDLLIDSDSYTPPFYLGRALPSAGVDLIVQALAHFKRLNGSFIPDADITYTWKQSGQVLGSISGRGKSSVIIPIEHLYGGSDITVVAKSSDGSRAGETTLSVPLTKPVLDLYEDHPLYGILYGNALSPVSHITEGEMAFSAVPYFGEARAVNDPALSYDWRVNDTRIPASAGAPQEITINAHDSSGHADVSLEVTHASNYYFDATGEWNIFLASASAAQDPFHAAGQ